METVVVNLTGKTRREKLHGRDYIVAPLTMIVPGVLNGSKGPLYYPPDEIAADPSIWNAIPIVVEHPTKNGNHVSARSADILNASQVGLILDAKVSKKGNLVAEGWFSVDDTKRVDDRVLQALEKGKKIELSTGLFTDDDLAENGASYNGTPYTHVARNHKPDHLAILMASVGACSIKDGCGVLVNEADKSLWQRLKEFVGITGNQPSHSELHTQLIKAIAVRYGYNAFIDAVYDKYVVYSWNERLYRLDYTTDLRSDEKVTLSNDAPEEVSRVVTYKPAVNTATKEEPEAASTTTEEPDMAKLTDDVRKGIVDNLIGNCECQSKGVWQEEDRKTLNAFPDEKLMTMDECRKKMAKMEANSAVANAAIAGYSEAFPNATFDSKTGKFSTNAKKEDPKDDDDEEEDDAEERKPAFLKKKKKDKKAENESNLTPMEQSQLAWAKREMDKRKTQIVNRLTANIADKDVKEKKLVKLNAMSLDALEEYVSDIQAMSPMGIGLALHEEEDAGEPQQSFVAHAGTPLKRKAGKVSVNSRENGLDIPEIDYSTKEEDEDAA